jgi:polyvinyl alcohol dehydrogenase (cytochrome)
MTKNRLVAPLCIGLAALLPGARALAANWPMFGQNVANTANNGADTVISKTNVSRLKPKWIATTGGDVSARPAVVGSVVYFPDWGGNLQALDAATGKVLWKNQLSAYGLPAGTVARASPAVVGGVLYIGTLTGANMLAIDAATGKLKWKTVVDTQPHAVVTGSASVAAGTVYVGVASTEEGVASLAGYQCCSFRGSVTALNAGTGAILWKTFTAPANYSGAAVWGSAPVVDAARKSIFVGTGNNYAKPTDPAYLTCIANGGIEANCLSPDDHVDSVVALDMTTGAVKWAKRLRDNDDWNTACFTDMPGQGNCPVGAGPDYDFGSAPNEFHVGTKVAVGAGQKSGIYSAFDADTGTLLWSRQAGPGSPDGGMMWGSATEGIRVYVSIGNSTGQQYAGGTAGSWAALDAVTGKILWQVPDLHGAVDMAPMTVSNGVVYAGSMGATAGWSNMLALDAATGRVLWKYPSGGSVIAGAVVANGVVYWGSGYAHLGPPFKGNNKFYAFSIDGK